MTLDPSAHKKAIQRFESLEEECNSIHNNKFDYSLFVYKNLNTKSVIICPIHGEFVQRLANHLSGQDCPKCARKTTIDKVKMSKEKFVELLKEVHPNIQCVSFVSYKEKGVFTCTKHQTINITSTPTNILRQEYGCQECVSEAMSSLRRMTNTVFLSKLKIVHKSNIVPLEEYKSSKSPMSFLCKKHNNSFVSTPFNVLQGRGCKICGGLLKYRKYLDEPTILYYIYLPEYNLYKIGITVQRVGISKRMYGVKNYKVLDYVLFNKGYDAYIMEQQILRDYESLRYTGGKVIPAGNSELFIKPPFNDKIIKIYKEEVK